MTNNECPICDRFYNDDKMTAMNMDEPEYRGYCRKCRKGIKKMGFKEWCSFVENQEQGDKV